MKNKTVLLFGVSTIVAIAVSAAAYSALRLSNERQASTLTTTNVVRAVTWQIPNLGPNSQPYFTISHMSSDGSLFSYQRSSGTLSIFAPDGTLSGQYSGFDNPPLVDFVVINNKLIYSDFGINEFDPQTKTKTLLSDPGSDSHCINPQFSLPGRDISQIDSSNLLVTCTGSVSGDQFYCDVSTFDVVAKSFQTILKTPCEPAHSNLGAVVAGADGKIYAEYSGSANTTPQLPIPTMSVGQRALYRYDLQSQQWQLFTTYYPKISGFGNTTLMYVDRYSSLYYILFNYVDKTLPNFTVVIASTSGNILNVTSRDLNSADALADITPDGRLILIKNLASSSTKAGVQNDTFSTSATPTPSVSK